jgi:bifunctional enzyme CysN/CysC
MIFEDQLATLERDSEARHAGRGASTSRCWSTAEAEREQGITIDVAYRFFSTEKRKFIVADTPGHEQYTRNMVDRRLDADVAVHAGRRAHGVAVQTRRHAFIASLLGIRHVVLAVNKMDLVGSTAPASRRSVPTSALRRQTSVRDAGAIPLSALAATTSCGAPQHALVHGPDPVEHLETVEIEERSGDVPSACPCSG